MGRFTHPGRSSRQQRRILTHFSSSSPADPIANNPIFLFSLVPGSLFPSTRFPLWLLPFLDLSSLRPHVRFHSTKRLIFAPLFSSLSKPNDRVLHCLACLVVLCKPSTISSTYYYLIPSSSTPARRFNAPFSSVRFELVRTCSSPGRLDHL